MPVVTTVRETEIRGTRTEVAVSRYRDLVKVFVSQVPGRLGGLWVSGAADTPEASAPSATTYQVDVVLGDRESALACAVGRRLAQHLFPTPVLVGLALSHDTLRAGDPRPLLEVLCSAVEPFRGTVETEEPGM